MPTLIGQAEAGATVTIRDGGAVPGTAVANAAAAWAFTTAALGNGVQSFTATAADKLGNVGGPSAAVTVTIDSVPPAAPSTLTFRPQATAVRHRPTT